MSLLCITGEVGGVQAECRVCGRRLCLIFDIVGTVLHFADEGCPWMLRTVCVDSPVTCPDCVPSNYAGCVLKINFASPAGEQIIPSHVSDMIKKGRI